VPTMWLSWNEVFRWCQTLARPPVGRNKKRLSSDQ
jgi:hypoxanthine phosphoribosyltransferase